ncbi:MAG: hypothetical protein HY002_10555 [Candidatus Rokubacteria bacterium]|nr:hypothetical protein [Candidatus Rokubacteria bacterium]
MRGQGRTRPWRWSAALLAVGALLAAGCGDSGSMSRSATSVTGPTVASEQTHSIDVEKKKKKGKDKDGKHKGRPEAELYGLVANKAGTCPTTTFTVNGTSVRANGVTEYEESLTCLTLANGNLVKVEGQPLGDGTVLAREVKLVAEAAPAGAVPGVRVALVAGGVEVAFRITNPEGKFEFENTTPGSYDLTVNGCTTPLASGISLVAQKNEVEGKLAPSASAICGVVLVRLEVKQGNHDLTTASPSPSPTPTD